MFLFLYPCFCKLKTLARNPKVDRELDFFEAIEPGDLMIVNGGEGPYDIPHFLVGLTVLSACAKWINIVRIIRITHVKEEV